MGDFIQCQNWYGVGCLCCFGVFGNCVVDGCWWECLVELVGLWGVGDGGQFGVWWVGVVCGDYGC